ncbi:3-deoxy-D-manno-octulosonic acid transferase [Rufibacter sp. LB8]|uniref:3-deoxy-D-manno-octulosonic acid transferase n=1 Tax=Rufibacter sp. LB8 TaxID=2777781 RepID=UPI00178C616C|nr:glycosyltransferase N-terminal domain-containing protein [Rufibacter sp. LB8]
MSKILYEVGISAYKWGVRLASPFHDKAAKFIKGRENVFQEMETQLATNTAPLVWFHCASLGEFEQGRPLIEGFRVKFPQFKILLTFFSPSGYEVRKNYSGADFIFYLPLDTEANASRFVKLVKPKMAIFVKYEFWHHYTKALRKRGIPLISISAIFRKNQIYFRKQGAFYRRILERFSHIYTQNQESAQLLASLNFTKVSNAGDTRADRVLQTAKTAVPIALAAAFKANAPVMVIGSSWPEDMKILLPFMQKHLPTLKFILAPHEIKEKDLREVETQFPGQTARFSQAAEDTVAAKRILLIDNIGILSQLYQYADYAYVGGAFGKGLHNTLEPAAFGPALFFGPKYDKFQEAVDLIGLGVAFPVRAFKELDKIFTALHQDPAKRAHIKQAAQTYIEKQAGATHRILTALEYWLPSGSKKNA